jgi:hypothetical protein
MGQRLSVTKTSEDFDEDGCLRGTFDFRVQGFGKNKTGPRALPGTLEFDSREAEGIRFKVYIGDPFYGIENDGSSPQRIKVIIFIYFS